MPKRKNPQTAEEQAKQFRREAQKLADDGSLTLTEGETGLDEFVRSAAAEKSEKQKARGS